LVSLFLLDIILIPNRTPKRSKSRHSFHKNSKVIIRKFNPWKTSKSRRTQYEFALQNQQLHVSAFK